MVLIAQKNLSSENFINLAPSFPILQEVIQDLDIERRRKMSTLYSYEHSQTARIDRKEETQESLEMKQAEVPMLISAVNSATNPKLKREYESRLHALNDDIERLSENLSKNSSSKLLKDTFKYKQTLAGVNEMDAWVDELGQWFETGALGEGSVTYNGKTYTYPKPA